MARDRELSFCGAGAGGQPPALQGERVHLKRLEPVLLCAVLAVSLHAAILSVPVRNEPFVEAPPRSAGTRSTSVRMLSLPEQAIAERTGTPIKRLANTFIPSSGNAELPPPADAEGDRRYEPLVVTPASPSPPMRGVALRLPGVLGDDDFFARGALDVGPSPAQPVLIDYPSVDAGSGTHVSELSLFIDENGRVVRIRVDGPPLPAAMEEAARVAFMGATFTPGQVDGLPVRSRIRVEVVFEEGPAHR